MRVAQYLPDHRFTLVGLLYSRDPWIHTLWALTETGSDDLKVAELLESYYSSTIPIQDKRDRALDAFGSDDNLYTWW